jgi:NhaA family Na+:H+ antiporter
LSTTAKKAPDASNRVTIISPLQDFLRRETAGAVLLAIGALIGLIWANSPWSESYFDFWHSEISVSVAGHTLALDLHAWLNDGLMTIFFFVVGLEIKRELTSGHLASRKAATLPIVAALGGMAAPALIYLAIAGGEAPRGWAIPMATDIALAVGALAVVATRISPGLRVFLLALAIVDDLGGIIVIAVVYTSDLQPQWLILAAAAVLAAWATRQAGVYSYAPYIALGVILWLALHESGIHTTIAGVIMGLLAPATPRRAAEYIDAEELGALSEAQAVRVATTTARGSVSIVEWLGHILQPWASFVIVPIFALANTGIEVSWDALGNALESKLAWGIFAGLVVGKPVGILAMTYLSTKAGIADKPAGAQPRRLLGVGTTAGIGFTVAIFITDLALTDPVQQETAKLAILIASVVALLISITILRSTAPLTQAELSSADEQSLSH